MDNKVSKYLFGILTVLCIILIVLSSLQDRIMDPVRNAVGYVLVPIQKGINHVGVAVYDKLEETKNLKYAYIQNKELSARVDSLMEENNRLKSESLELQRLRSLYSLDQTYLDYPKVAARIIAKDSEKWFQVFRIDKGSSDGIQKDMNVLSGGGLCGIVTDVGANYATVRTIIDDESNVAAMSQSSGDSCFVKGNLTQFENGLLDLANIDKNANINEGDAIVTSNISTKFLPGILIGYASNIQIDSQHLTKSGSLIPVADFDHLQEVLVITQRKTDTGIVNADGSPAQNADGGAQAAGGTGSDAAGAAETNADGSSVPATDEAAAGSAPFGSGDVQQAIADAAGGNSAGASAATQSADARTSADAGAGTTQSTQGTQSVDAEASAASGGGTAPANGAGGNG